MRKDFVHLIASQPEWHALRLFRPFDIVNTTHLLFEDLLVKKQDRTESLVLRRCRYITNPGQVGEKLRDLRRAHLVGMTQLMETDKALDPVAIRAFRSQTVVLEAQDIAGLIEYFFGLVCAVGRGYD